MQKYKWLPATGPDVENIVKMAQNHFETEIDIIFNPEPITYSRNITLAVVNQHFSPLTELLSVAKDSETGQLLAYTWAKSDERAPWSDDNMTVVRMAHVDLNLSSKTRIQLVKDMMTLWEEFAKLAKTPIICSTTMRREQDSFLKLHAKNGYDVRGSYAYKRVIPMSN